MRITSALWHSNTHLGHLFLFLDNVLNVSPSQSIFGGVATCRIMQDIVDGMHTLLRFGNKNVRADIGPADPRLPRLSFRTNLTAAYRVRHDRVCDRRCAFASQRQGRSVVLWGGFEYN